MTKTAHSGSRHNALESLVCQKNGPLKLERTIIGAGRQLTGKSLSCRERKRTRRTRRRRRLKVTETRQNRGVPALPVSPCLPQSRPRLPPATPSLAAAAAILIGTPTLRSNPYCVSATPAAATATLPRLFPRRFSASQQSSTGGERPRVELLKKYSTARSYHPL